MTGAFIEFPSVALLPLTNWSSLMFSKLSAALLLGLTIVGASWAFAQSAARSDQAARGDCCVGLPCCVAQEACCAGVK